MITKVINPEVGSYRAINTDFAEGLPGQPVVIAQPAEESGDRIWVLDSVQYSYKGSTGALTLVAGGLTVRIDDKVKLDVDIQNFLGDFQLYIPSQTDKVISVTLKPGGNGVIGKLNTQWHLEPAA